MRFPKIVRVTLSSKTYYMELFTNYDVSANIVLKHDQIIPEKHTYLRLKDNKTITGYYHFYKCVSLL
jgi:hypothetical protein